MVDKQDANPLPWKLPPKREAAAAARALLLFPFAADDEDPGDVIILEPRMLPKVPAEFVLLYL